MADLQVIDTRKEKVARMVAQGVPLTTLAKIMRVSIADVQAFIETEDMKALIGEIHEAAFDDSEVLDNSWDNAEALALQQIIENLQQVPDKDYALRVAMVASKAQRRQKVHSTNNTIPVREDLQTVITLNATFTTEIQKRSLHGAPTQTEIEKKIENVLNPKATKELLGAATPVTLEHADITDGLFEEIPNE